MGLSPRVRGNPCVYLGKYPSYRSIPACAGEPPRCARAGIGSMVYPRVCGGTFIYYLSVRSNEGLSPRVRGNRKGIMDSVKWAGSIPACAGEPGHKMFRKFLTAVYPRVCGGTCWFDGFLPYQVGSIPACAGEPSRLIPNWMYHGVYPRVCGGTLKWCASGDADKGLSPRVRGNLPVSTGRMRW